MKHLKGKYIMEIGRFTITEGNKIILPIHYTLPCFLKHISPHGTPSIKPFQKCLSLISLG